MEISFELTKKDWLKFQLSHTLSIKYNYILIIIPVLFITFDVMKYGFFIALIFGVLFYVVLQGLSMLITLIYFLLNQDVILYTSTKVTIEKLGIRYETKYANNMYYWSNQIRIIERMGNLMIYISKNMAIIIPKHAFKDVNQQDFVRTIQENSKKTH